MRIAVDLSPLQNAHRMRGIGFTLINFLNNLPEAEKSQHSFVFYVLPEAEALFKDPLELINAEGLDYQIRTLKHVKRIHFRLPGRLNLPIGAFNRLLRFHSFYFGDSRVEKVTDIDVFFQADQNHSLPSGRFKKVLVIYDLIPQILEWDYLLTYPTARLQGKSRVKSFVLASKRRLIIQKIRRNTRRAHKLVAISEHTKNDFIELLGTPSQKITVAPLGVSVPTPSPKAPKLTRSVKTGWGYAARPLKLDPQVPFLLFVGGVDSRRKIEDLVTAFNNLRAQGKEIKLVLAGDILLGPSAITTPQISEALAKSSYLDDIIFMGFIDDDTRNWLYTNALAFVFPSRYEGFGLPVLEAMVHGCPVICYKNGAAEEVAGTSPLYTKDQAGIQDRVQELLSAPKADRLALQKRNIAQAKKYDWRRTSKQILSVILYNPS